MDIANSKDLSYSIDTKNVAKDLDIEKARRAHYNTSFDPERRGDDMVSDYIGTMMSLAAYISDNAKDDRQRATMQNVFDGLRDELKGHYNKWINAKSRCASSFITGPANFPVAKAEKANNAEHKAAQEVFNFENNMRKYAIKKLNAVYSVQEKQTGEIEKIKKKIICAKHYHGAMKAVNAIVRKHESYDKRKEQLELLGFSENEIAALLKPDCVYRIGFETFQLSNNLASIKRMQQRLKELEAKSNAN